MSDRDKNEFEKAATDQRGTGLFRELWGFLSENKKWWMLPIIAVLLLFGILIILSGTGLAPFIYTLF